MRRVRGGGRMLKGWEEVGGVSGDYRGERGVGRLEG